MPDIYLKNSRLSFPYLHKADVDDKGQAQYRAAFILDPATEDGAAAIAALKAAIKEETVKKWGDKPPAKMRVSVLKDGNEEGRPECVGKFVCNANNSIKPTLVDRDRAPLTAESGKPYGGCYVNAKINVHAWDNTNGKGIRASLLGVQFVSDGDAFAGGRVAGADEFEALSPAEEEFFAS